MNTIERLTENEMKKYFGTHHVHYHISSFGKLIVIDLTYQDFHPIPVVREWLNEHIPFLWNLNVERTYSKKVSRKAVSKIVQNDPDILIRVEELLFSKDLG